MSQIKHRWVLKLDADAVRNLAGDDKVAGLQMHNVDTSTWCGAVTDIFVTFIKPTDGIGKAVDTQSATLIGVSLSGEILREQFSFRDQPMRIVHVSIEHGELCIEFSN